VIKGWVWVSTTYYTVGIDVENNVITYAPPIVKWAKGKTLSEYKTYLVRKGILIDWREFTEK
jgi:hypothetical protein